MGDILQPPGHPISYFPKLAKVTGSVKAAILAQQISYWTPRAHDAEGWIYKSQTGWMDETGFTLKEFRGACQELESRKLIVKEYDRMNHELRIQLQIEAYNLALQGIKENRAPAKRAHAKRAHAKRAHAKREDGIFQKGTWHVPKGHFDNNEAETTTETTTEKEDTPERANALSTPEGLHEQEGIEQWMREWPKAKRFPKDFPPNPPPWFLQWTTEHAPGVDVANEWPHMRDYTFKSPRTQFFMVARKWMENEATRHPPSRASPRHYTQADKSPEAQERLRKKLEAIDRGDG